jgi:methionine-gamma-lyase
VAFASGMAAISSTLFSNLEPGDQVIAHNVLYGSSYNVMTNILPRYGVKVKLIDLTNLDNIKKAIDNDTQLIYFETPSNPTMEIIDIQKVAQIAKKSNARVAVDNTFATPYFQRPLDLGADIVIHSATKYISGHGDVVAGLVVANDKDYVKSLKFDYMCEFGGVMSPFNGWLLLRGLKTLSFRMNEHEKNAKIIANYLTNHRIVNKVYYPGLEDFKGHQIAKKQMSGFGAMIGLEIDGSLQQIKKFLNSLNLIKLAVSLGDTETLIEYPFGMTHRDYTEKELQKFGLKKNLVRLSIGLEDPNDIKEDLNQAFNSL